MRELDIYIKPVKKANVTAQDQLFIQDVAEVVATADVAEKVKHMKLMDMTARDKAHYLVSVTDIIKLIKKTYPDYTVNNVGAEDTVIQYTRKQKKDNAVFKWLKVAFVSLVLLAGSATAIMSFHTDAQIPKVFENFYKIFYGESKDNPLIIDIPYSIGLALGIVVFYNHFFGRKITDDPTPIEVEMALYETEVNETVLDVLNTRRSADSTGEEGRHDERN